MTYADNTQVPVERSRAEIERTLTRYGATAFGYMTEPGRAVIMFEAHDRRIRFDLPLPRPDEERFWVYKRGQFGSPQRRTESGAREQWEQACRQRWRALALAVKAKLEAVEAGIAEFEDEFAAYVCLPNGSTVGEWLRPQIEQVYSTGLMPPMMALGRGDSANGSAQ